MMGEPIFEITISGQVSTNSNRGSIENWRKGLEDNLSILPPSLVSGKKLSIEMKFWLSKKRLDCNSKNDLDNLVKPVLDSMKRIQLIEDDAFVYQLQVTKHPTSGIEQLSMTIREWVS